MSERMNAEPAPGNEDRFWTATVPAAPWGHDEPPLDHPGWGQAPAARPVDEAVDTLVSSYIVANLNGPCLPLREFMDDFEKRILRACLALTQGHQRHTADILGLKYTALFEKMRKHCINGKQLKLSRRLRPEPAAE